MAQGYAKFTGSTDDDESTHIEYEGNFANNTFNHFETRTPARYRYENAYQYMGCFKSGNAEGAGT